jgi:hypothetical protein
MLVYTSVIGNSINPDEFALTMSSEAFFAGVKSASFSLMRPPYWTGRFSGAINLFGF